MKKKEKLSVLEKFSKFNKSLQDKVKKEIKFKKFAKITEYIPMGNYLLNAQMSGSLFNGVPTSRSVEIAGDPSTGKTFLALNIIREATKLGFFIYWIDSEGAVDEELFKMFGCDGRYIEHIRTIKTFNQVKFFINNLIEQKKEEPDMKIAVILDSYALLSTDKEMKDALIGKSAADMGLRAKEGRALFRTITLDLANLSIPFIFTNHTSSSFDLFKSGSTIGGGGGPTYAASIILKLGKKALRDGVDVKTKTGIIVRSATEKNRLARPIDIVFHISYEKGMNPYVGLQDYISWESCGVQRGKILTPKEFEKEKEDDKKKNKEYEYYDFEHEGKKMVFYAKDTARTYGVKWICENIPIEHLFTKKVFGDKTLEELNKNIESTFKYKDYTEILEDEDLDLSNFTEVETEEDEEENLIKSIN